MMRLSESSQGRKLPRIGEIMAVYNKNSLIQISGFNNQIIAGELVFEQQTYWNLTLNNSGDLCESGTTPPTPLDLTGATIDAQIIRRRLENVRDTRYGLTFDIYDYTPAPTAIPLTITNRVNASGLFTLVIDSDAWGLVSDDAGLDIASINGVGYPPITLNFLNGTSRLLKPDEIKDIADYYETLKTRVERANFIYRTLVKIGRAHV